MGGMKRRVCKHCAREYVSERGGCSGCCSLPCRFWSKVQKSGDADGCWEWAAGKVRGYGQFRVNGKPHLAHRVSYELHYGPIPTGEGHNGTCVLHRCDNPICVNPGHLFLGNHQDNMRDMVEKDRQPKGEAHGRSVLTQVQVDEIRESYSKGGVTYVQLGREYGVDRSQIGNIVNRKNWE